MLRIKVDNKADLLLYKDYLAMQLYSRVGSKNKEYHDKLLSEYKSTCKKLNEIDNGKKQDKV